MFGQSLHACCGSWFVAAARGLILVLVGHFCAALLADEPVAFLAREGPLAARLVGIDREANLSLAVGGTVRIVPARELAYWGRYRDSSAGPQILLLDGSLIRADVLKIDDESLVVGDATGLGRGLWDDSTLPRSAVRAILFQPPAGTADRDRLLAQLAEPNNEDRLWLSGGESLGGTLASAPQAGPFLPEDAASGQELFRWQFPAAAEPLAIPAGKVIAISQKAAEADDRPSVQSIWLGCRDGSLLHVAAVHSDADAIELLLTGGGALRTTVRGREDPDKSFWDAITLVQVGNGGRAESATIVWLSNQTPLGYKHIPLLSLARSYAVDRSVVGGRLRSGEGVFLKGLGMHTTSRLAYDVGGYRSFAAELALNESAGTGGSVIFRVLVQDPAGTWRAGYVSGPVRGGEAPIPISVDITGAARLALIVEFADWGDMLDHANWLSARLVK